METFNFPFHTVYHEHPEGDAVKFGNGYEYGLEPQLPVQRIFTLAFNSLQWIRDGDGNYSPTPNPTQNIMALDEFYARHRRHKTFIYVHEVYGSLNVRFAQSFKCPKSLPGGTGYTEGFELKLIEQP